MRAAIYARFSTDMQSAASVADQLRICRDAAAKMGAEVVGEFEDAGISGSAMANRPGLQAMLRLAKARGCDVVIAEHTDRLSRGFSDSGAIYEDLKSWGVDYFTVNQGKVGMIQAGFSGVMSAMMIEEGAKKTRRGLEGVVLSGRSAGGMAYGYRSPLAYDAKGDRIRGLREVDEAEAAVVRRIFEDYASGASPLALADSLNREGVEPPRGTHWLASTILGSGPRGTGILRNELYRGVRVWGRLGTVKDRISGKRRHTLQGGGITRMEVPELRIVDEALWNRSQARMHATSTAVGGTGQRRPLLLFSGLIKCGCCGGTMTRAGTGDYLRCSGRTNRGLSTCSNTRNPPYSRVERVVLAGIEANLLHPVAISEALKAFQETLKAERRTVAQTRGPTEAELADVKRRIARLVREVEDGMPWSAVSARHAELAARQGALEAALALAPVGADVVRLHTASAADYRAFVADLRGNLTKPSHAREAIRGLVEEVRFIPKAGKGAFDLDITADLAPLLGVNGSGTELMRALEPRSCCARWHEFRVQFRRAG